MCPTRSHVSKSGKHETYQQSRLSFSFSSSIAKTHQQKTGRPPTETCERVFNIKEYHTIVADATGSYLRGRQTREVKSHVKAGVLIGVKSILRRSV